MLIITRRLARRLRTVFRQALNLSTYSALPPIRMQGGDHGLTIRAMTAGAAVEFHLPGDQPEETIWLPPEILGEVQGAQDDPVRISAGPGGTCASWRERDIPQLIQHPAPRSEEDFPKLPPALAENGPRLLQALHDASQTADSRSIRYALGCLQLQGASGRIVATDGRQLLVQSGFTFPWDDKVLLPKTALFGCKQLPHDEPVQIGRSAARLVVRAGGWTFWQSLHTDGQFPDVDHHIPAPAAETSRLAIAPSDGRFLLASLSHLPSADQHNQPLTVDLNGHVALRGRSPGQPQPTELRLTRSSYTGEAVRVNTNRHYLARAVSLGFDEIRIFGPTAPLLACDDRRQYVWAVLDAESAIGPRADAVRIDSPTARAGSQPHPNKRRSQNTMTRSQSSPAGQSKSIADSAETGSDGNGRQRSTLELAVALRDTLREAAGTAGRLVRTLRSDQKQSKALQATLASLRQLETLDV